MIYPWRSNDFCASAEKIKRHRQYNNTNSACRNTELMAITYIYISNLKLSLQGKNHISFYVVLNSCDGTCKLIESETFGYKTHEIGSCYFRCPKPFAFFIPTMQIGYAPEASNGILGSYHDVLFQVMTIEILVYHIIHENLSHSRKIKLTRGDFVL